MAIKKDGNNKLILAAPHGIDDLVNCVLRPASFKPKRIKEFRRRIESKQWLEKWPKLQIIEKPITS